VQAQQAFAVFEAGSFTTSVHLIEAFATSRRAVFRNISPKKNLFTIFQASQKVLAGDLVITLWKTDPKHSNRDFYFGRTSQHDVEK